MLLSRSLASLAADPVAIHACGMHRAVVGWLLVCPRSSGSIVR